LRQEAIELLYILCQLSTSFICSSPSDERY